MKSAWTSQSAVLLQLIQRDGRCSSNWLMSDTADRITTDAYTALSVCWLLTWCLHRPCHYSLKVNFLTFKIAEINFGSATYAFSCCLLTHCVQTCTFAMKGTHPPFPAIVSTVHLALLWRLSGALCEHVQTIRPWVHASINLSSQCGDMCSQHVKFFCFVQHLLLYLQWICDL